TNNVSVILRKIIDKSSNATRELEGIIDNVVFAFQTHQIVYWQAWIQMGLILFLCLTSTLGAIILIIWILRQHDGTNEMKAVGDPIRWGANGFMRTQYSTIAVLIIPVALILFLLFAFRQRSTTDPHIHTALIALIISLSFLLGALSSAIAGFIGMWVAVRANIRVAACARESYTKTMNVAIRSGASVGFLIVALSVLGVAILFMILYGVISPFIADPQQIPILIVGYGFGASFVA